MAVNIQKGFSLIELMVVVAIVGILVATTAPVGKFWVEGARVTSVESEFREAIGKAKGIALRNATLSTGSDAVTSICLSNSELTVLSRSDPGSPNCSTNLGELRWSAELSDDVTVTADGNSVSCMCFNSSGMLTSACGGCSTSTKVDITSGSKSKSLLIY